MNELYIEPGCIVVAALLVICMLAIYIGTEITYFRWRHKIMQHITCPKCGHEYYANVRFNVFCCCGETYLANEHRWTCDENNVDEDISEPDPQDVDEIEQDIDTEFNDASECTDCIDM